MSDELIIVKGNPPTNAPEDNPLKGSTDKGVNIDDITKD